MTTRRPPEAPAPIHSDAAHAAITTELQRLTLGGRGPARPELLTGFRRLALAIQQLGRAFTGAGMALTRWQQSWIKAAAAAEEHARLERAGAAHADPPITVLLDRAGYGWLLDERFFDQGRRDDP